MRVTTGSIEVTPDGGVRLSQSFVLEHPREAVWALMSDPEAVALCMPGARLDGPPQDGKITGRIEVGLGPIVARFAGAGSVRQLPDDYRQVIEGHGADRRSGSRVSGSVDYRLSLVAGASGGPATRVDVAIGYALTGLLAQIGRSGLARDLAQRIGEAFAQNIDARLRRAARHRRAASPAQPAYPRLGSDAGAPARAPRPYPGCRVSDRRPGRSDARRRRAAHRSGTS